MGKKSVENKLEKVTTILTNTGLLANSFPLFPPIKEGAAEEKKCTYKACPTSYPLYVKDCGG